MSIFGNIMSAIFKSSTPAATAPASAPASASPAGPATAAAPASGTQPAGSADTATLERPAAPAAPAAAHERVDVAAVLTKLASQNKEKLDWRRSIVDLMKLLKLDSSHAARKQLAKELHYAGDMSDSAEMNMWLHRQVMQKLAENGGKVPADLMSN